MSEVPHTARKLVLDLVRPQVEGGACPRCGASLEGCRLDLGSVEPERIDVVATCPGCGGEVALRLRPAADGGAASVR
ncbi:MAG: hypothetical protein J2P38_04810 [Candidatus Dormibacteraeota bacterium]|nr:hypothetical protein [Candidatus Dormibacteraeota bacterium]